MISDLDILDGTPVLDIKPYFREFESDAYIKTGWIEKRKLQNDCLYSA
jgi:tRNA (Thr-GGU) A37 N-methylase